METILCLKTALGMKKGRYYPAIRDKLNKLVINIGEGRPFLTLSEEQLKAGSYGCLCA